MAFADLTANLRLNTADFSAKMADASAKMSRFARSLNDSYGQANASLRSHNMGLKDTARIVQGIVVAQAFYTGARAIREATQSLWDFNKALDYAKVTYSALFGDVNLANDFMSVLQEHAINTMFDYQSLADASKKLLAYGIEYENLMFIMEGLTNLGAMSGDTAALDRISLALGQIYTRGKLTAEEMRQLANAYVPISDIIQEKFNLTPDQMSRVSDLNLPAAEVINAVVDYANERFGSVGDAAMYTITGIEAKIVDTIKTTGTEMLASATTVYKSFLVFISNALDNLRNAYASGGSGGIFEYLVPDKDTQTIIRQFLANVKNLFMSLMSVGVVAGQVFGNFAFVVATAFNIVAPLITGFTNALALLLHSMLNTTTGTTVLRIALLAAASAFVIFRVQAMAALVVTAVTKAVMGLSKALMLLASIVTRHPILMLLAGLAIALVGVSVASSNANKSIAGLFDTLSGATGGNSQADILQRIEKDIKNNEDAADQFNNRLDDGASAAENLENGINGAGKAAEKAAKKATGLLSFDEVFKLNEPVDPSAAAGAGSGLGAGLADDLSGLIDGLGGLGDALIPDIPDFRDFINGFTEGLFGGLEDSLIGKLAAAGLGAAFVKKLFDALDKSLKGAEGMAGVAKFIKGFGNALLGGFLGYGFDAIASLLTDKLWSTLEKALKLPSGSAEMAGISSTFGSVVGGAIGMLVGGLPGSLIGAAIGHLAGGIVGLLWQEIDGALSSTVTGALAGVAAAIAKSFSGSISEVARAFVNAGSFSGFFKSIGSIFSATGAKALLKGGVIGAAIGFVTDGIAALLWNGLSERFEGTNKETAKVGQTIGSVLGTVIGGLLGGPVGALIGSAIGTFAGGFVGLFWDKIEAYFDPETNAFSRFLVETAKQIGIWSTNTLAGFSNWWKESYRGFSDWFSDTLSGFSTWWNDSFNGFSTWLKDTIAGITSWWRDTIAIFSDWDNITSETLGNWWSDTISGFTTWWTDTFSGFTTWRANTFGSISAWALETATSITTWATNTMSSYTSWWSQNYNGFVKWRRDVFSTVSSWVLETTAKIGTWVTDTIAKICGWVSNTLTAISNWRNDALAVIAGFGKAALLSISEKLEEVKTTWSTKWASIRTAFETWWKELKPAMRGWLEDSVWDPISNFFSLNNFWNRIKGMLDAIKEKLTSWWDSLKSMFSERIEVSTPSVSGGGGSSSGGGSGRYTGHNNGEVATKPSSTSGSSSSGSSGSSSSGVWWNTSGPIKQFATGGIVSRDQIARIAEGNKAEAIIPLENASAMQPFVDAVSNGIVGSLAPIVASISGNGNSENLPPLYVGTLIADDRGLKQLYKKFEIIQVQENARRGIRGTV